MHFVSLIAESIKHLACGLSSSFCAQIFDRIEFHISSGDVFCPQTASTFPNAYNEFDKSAGTAAGGFIGNAGGLAVDDLGGSTGCSIGSSVSAGSSMDSSARGWSSRGSSDVVVIATGRGTGIVVVVSRWFGCGCIAGGSGRGCGC